MSPGPSLCPSSSKRDLAVPKMSAPNLAGFTDAVSDALRFDVPLRRTPLGFSTVHQLDGYPVTLACVDLSFVLFFLCGGCEGALPPLEVKEQVKAILPVSLPHFVKRKGLVTPIPRVPDNRTKTPLLDSQECTLVTVVSPRATYGVPASFNTYGLVAPPVGRRDPLCADPLPPLFSTPSP